MVKAEGIRQAIASAQPDLKNLLYQVEPVKPIVPREVSVLTAISRIVIGQMLSRKAAVTIINNATNLANDKKLPELAYLNREELRKCGLSERKIITIHKFAAYCDANRAEIESWRSLQASELMVAVSKHWGLAEWTFSMLAIFYFGMEDVFPAKDGTIQRALKALSASGIELKETSCKPYRSYLALYLWKLVDEEVLPGSR